MMSGLLIVNAGLVLTTLVRSVVPFWLAAPDGVDCPGHPSGQPGQAVVSQERVKDGGFEALG